MTPPDQVRVFDVRRRHLLVGVSGKGRNCSEEVRTIGYGIGEVIGMRAPDLVLVTGGLGGVMAAAAEAATEKHCALSIGLMPGVDSRTTEAGPSAISIDTGMSTLARNVIFASAVDLLVACPGGDGTLQEMVMARDLGKPVWGIDAHGWKFPDSVWRGLCNQVIPYRGFSAAIDNWLDARRDEVRRSEAGAMLEAAR
jgi:uncharacterized protein (TIGR00725 family)